MRRFPEKISTKDMFFAAVVGGHKTDRSIQPNKTFDDAIKFWQNRGHSQDRPKRETEPSIDPSEQHVDHIGAPNYRKQKETFTQKSGGN